MNPCIDRTITIEKPIEIGGTHRVLATREEISGKGINVSGLLKNWNLPTKCLGFDFRRSKLPVARALCDRQIPAWLHSVDGKIRCNIKVFDTAQRTMTEFNEKGPAVKEEDISALCLLIEKQLMEMSKEDLLVLTGSVPPGVPKDIYKQIIERAAEKGIRTVLDASGELLKEGIEYYNYLTPAKKVALPCFPLGFTDFHKKNAACGLKTENKVYLAVWNLGDNKPVTVNLDFPVKSVTVGYPKKMKTDFSIEGNTLTVNFPCEYSARFFEIEIKK